MLSPSTDAVSYTKRIICRYIRVPSEYRKQRTHPRLASFQGAELIVLLKRSSDDCTVVPQKKTDEKPRNQQTL